MKAHPLLSPARATELRGQPRMRIFKAGLISHDGVTFPCIVRNLSDGGAGVMLDAPQLLPPTARLLVADSIYTCSKVWQRDLRAGFRFVATR